MNTKTCYGDTEKMVPHYFCPYISWGDFSSLPSLSAGACSAFVSRTGKTTDVTQIKGWREKFTPAEASSTPKPPTAEGDVSGVFHSRSVGNTQYFHISRYEPNVNGTDTCFILSQAVASELQ